MTGPKACVVWISAALAGALAACTASSEVPPSIRVTVAPAEARVDVGATVAFSAAVTGTVNTGVVWSVPEASACGSVTQAALYSAPPAPAVCHVLARSIADTTKGATATVTVTDPGPPTALVISPNPATVAVNGTLPFTVSPSVPVTWSVTETGGTTGATPVYPLKAATNGRYLEDQNNQPWRIQADAAWLMSANATAADVDTYLGTRKAQGFNSFYLMAMVHPGGYGAAPNAPNDAAGHPPFATPNDFSTAGTSAASALYWAWIDTIVDKAAAQGMVVMLAYTYLGYNGESQGWYSTLLAQPSRQACTNWGTWLGNRYKSKPNVIWFALGDYTPPAGSEGEARALAIINGIKAAGATQPFMAEPSGGDSNPILDAPAFASVLDLDSFYGYGPTGHGDCYLQAERAYRATPPKPVWVQEGGYEFENNTGGFTGQSYETRRTRFWSVLAGGTAGDGFGTRDVYQWQGLPGSLSTPGAAFAKHAFGLFASIPWWDLRPSGTGTGFAGRTLVTSGGGTKGAMDWVTSAVSGDGTTLMAYIPTTGGTVARTITVDMSAMSGTTQARWWDPAAGTFTSAGTGLANTGTRSFTSPGANGGGQNDWVLLLDGAGTGRCGTISASGLYAAPASVPAGVTCQVTATLQSDPSVVAHAQVNLQ